MSHHVDAAAAWIYRGVWASVVGLFKRARGAVDAAGGRRAGALAPPIARLPAVPQVPVLGRADSGRHPAGRGLDRGVDRRARFSAWCWRCPSSRSMFLPDVFAYVGIHLRYDTTWYVLTDRSLRIRRGILTIHETTISFENVQNVEVRQGPLQRYFGIADVHGDDRRRRRRQPRQGRARRRRSARTSASCRVSTTPRRCATRSSPASSGRDRRASATSIRGTSAGGGVARSRRLVGAAPRRAARDSRQRPPSRAIVSTHTAVVAWDRNGATFTRQSSTAARTSGVFDGARPGTWRRRRRTSCRRRCRERTPSDPEEAFVAAIASGHMLFVPVDRRPARLRRRGLSRRRRRRVLGRGRRRSPGDDRDHAQPGRRPSPAIATAIRWHEHLGRCTTTHTQACFRRDH